MNNIKCQFCNANSWSIIEESYNKYQLIKCNNCGVITIYPLPSTDDLNKFYTDYLYKYGYRFLIKDDRILHYYLKRWRRRFNKIQKIVQRKGNLLDVGCSLSVFLKYCQDRGWHVCGVEISEREADFVIENYKIKVYKKTLEKINFEKKKFAVVTMWDVFEHLNNPVEVFEKIKKILKDDGLIALSTINYDCLNRKLFRKKWRYLIPPEHIFYFTPNFLKQYFRNQGFHIVEMRTYFAPQNFWNGFMGLFRKDEKDNFVCSRNGLLTLLKIKDFLADLFNIILSHTDLGDIIEVYLKKEDDSFLEWKIFWNDMANKNNSLKKVNRNLRSIKRDIDYVIDVLKINEKDTVLDFCCGNGLITNKIARNCKLIYGIDFSSNLIKDAIENAKSNHLKVFYTVGSLDKLSEYNNFFDKIYCLTSFHYFPSDEYARLIIKNALKALKKNGKILITDVPNKRTLWYFIWKLIRNNKDFQKIEPIKLQPTLSWNKKILIRLKLLFRRFTNKKVESDDWLWYDPNFFLKFKNDNIDIVIKKSIQKNSFLNYRFDLIITKKQ